MTYLGGSVAYLWSQINLWTGRANAAWGSSGSWNSGASWQQNYTDEVAAYNSLLATYNNLVTSYNAMVADRNAWQSRANQAYDGGVWGSGNLWSADAHNDPGVWTNRYNQGYADGGAAKTTSSQSTTAWSGQTATNWGWVSMGCSLSVPLSGAALVVVRGHLDAGGGDPKATMRLLANGGVIATGPQTAVGTGSPGGECIAVYQGNLGAGTVITVEGLGTSFSGNSARVTSGQMWLTVGAV